MAYCEDIETSWCKNPRHPAASRIGSTRHHGQILLPRCLACGEQVNLADGGTLQIALCAPSARDAEKSSKGIAADRIVARGVIAWNPGRPGKFMAQKPVPSAPRPRSDRPTIMVRVSIILLVAPKPWFVSVHKVPGARSHVNPAPVAWLHSMQAFGRAVFRINGSCEHLS